MTKFGRYQVAEPPRTLAALHWHRGEPLREVDHEPRVAVLDQEDLIRQGIDTAALIRGAQRVDALGSCTANAYTAALSNVVADRSMFTQETGASGFDDTKGAEEFAIRFYHGCTDQTGDPGTEWPPTDCGSSGPYVTAWAEHLGQIGGAVVAAHTAESLCSLMQTGGLMVGQPWLRAWMEPDSRGFIDGAGTVGELERAVQGGVAGGHETFWSSIERLTVSETGAVDPFRTVLRARNSWSRSFADDGSYRFHLSTFVMLASHCDWRQLQARGG